MNPDWAENFNLVGIGEVRKIDQLVGNNKVNDVNSKMESHLTYTIAKVTLTDEEAALVERSSFPRSGLSSIGM